METSPRLSSTFKARARATAVAVRAPTRTVVEITASWLELALIAAGSVGIVLVLEALATR